MHELAFGCRLAEHGFVLCRAVGLEVVACRDQIFACRRQGHTAVVVALKHVGHGVGTLALGIDTHLLQVFTYEADREGVAVRLLRKHLEGQFGPARRELELLVVAGIAIDKELVAVEMADVDTTLDEAGRFDREAQGAPCCRTVGTA